MAKLSILVIDDDPLARKVIGTQLSAHDVQFAEDVVSARKKIASGSPDLCFIDLALSDGDPSSGLDLIPLAAAKGIYSVVMSGHDTQKYVERAYELGCNDFYSKGNEETNVGRILAKFLERREMPQDGRLFVERFITEDPATMTSMRETLKYASSDLPVLILGPSGTGKTSLARIIHDRSRRPGEFVAINCSAYTEELLETELFGYRKGAFTGAGDSRKGKLLLADKGTLFLDEIGSMSLNMQTKLLKAIEERSFYPIGSDRSETSQFRVISATLEDVQVLIKVGKLRFDFFQRIHGLTIELKPLSQRKCDIFPLVAHFTRGGRKFSFTADAKERLLVYDWPGNIRELKKFVELLAAGHEGRVTLETVNHLLTSVRAEESGHEYVTAEQYRLAKERGLDQAANRFIDTIIAKSLAENEGKRRQVLRDLHISTRLLYASLERSGQHPLRRSGDERKSR
jgi:DNA-binding NtrC family response regulator